MQPFPTIFVFCLLQWVACAQDSLLRLHLLFAGDIMGHGSQIQAAQVEKNVLYDYSPCFQYVEPYVKAADLSIANLEVTLPGSPPYQGYPQFRSPDDLALALRYAGFNFLATANNHSNDSGPGGLTHTLEVLEGYGFFHTGTFRDSLEKEAMYPLLVYKNGFRLAFLNYTYDTNGIPTKAPTIVNEIKEDDIKRDLNVCNMLQPDATIVIMHWGNEYETFYSNKQLQLAEKMIGWGADLIIGAHPHVVQPIKRIESSSESTLTRQALVVFSLGNFISGQTKVNTDGGLVFEVFFEKNLRTQTTRIVDHSYFPIWRLIHKDDEGKTQFYVLPISLYEGNGAALPLNISEKDKTAMKNFADRVRNLLKTSHSKERILFEEH